MAQTQLAVTEQNSERDGLIAAIAPIRSRLIQQGDRQADPEDADTHSPKEENISPSATPPSTPLLSQLCDRLHLSEQDRQLILLCLGSELDDQWLDLCAQFHQNQQSGYPTFRLAQQIIPGLPESTMSPTSSLRSWYVIEKGPDLTLMAAPLRLSERILHYLLGTQCIDENLIGIVEPVTHSNLTLPTSQAAVVDKFKTAWHNKVVTFQLNGQEKSLKKAIASQFCQALNLPLFSLSANFLPLSQEDFRQTLRLLQREAKLQDYVLIIDFEDIGSTPNLEEKLTTLIAATDCPVITISSERKELPRKAVYTTEVSSPTPDEQRLLWKQALGHKGGNSNIINLLVSQFDLGSIAIRDAATTAIASSEESMLETKLWQACRIQARPRLDALCTRIEAKETWEDLVLPEKQKQVLNMLIAHNRERTTVYEEWGFSNKSSRGLGTSALFSGQSGTGKTMAANVIAQKLNLDLYKVDLSTVVSKYIGETEKNLKKIFDAAESGGVILLFDEADAIFGKRSEVKDARDRYANMEVSYLLQRMESYSGLAILTTNMRDNIDQAFLRRLRFITDFPFPDYEQRYEIWQRVFPSGVPTKGLDYFKLADLNAAGGNIRSIALSAAFIAASEPDEEQPSKRASVTMERILRAARMEYSKLERSLPLADARTWLETD